MSPASPVTPADGPHYQLVKQAIVETLAPPEVGMGRLAGGRMVEGVWVWVLEGECWKVAGGVGWWVLEGGCWKVGVGRWVLGGGRAGWRVGVWVLEGRCWEVGGCVREGGREGDGPQVTVVSALSLPGMKKPSSPFPSSINACPCCSESAPGLAAQHSAVPAVHAAHAAQGMLVAPYMLSGMTDSRYYGGGAFPLAPGRVFRFSPQHYARGAGDISRVHGVDERVRLVLRCAFTALCVELFTSLQAGCTAWTSG